jgi:hypothetical protein
METKNVKLANTDVKVTFENARSNVIIRTKQIPKAAFIYHSQDDLKGAIEFVKSAPKASVNDAGKVVLSFGKCDLSDNTLILLNEVGKVSEIISLEEAEKRFEIVAQK